MKLHRNNKVVELKQGDITEQDTDAIVNAANSQLAHGGGVARAIASKAGQELQQESRDAPEVPTGEVYTTTAGRLNAKYVIHAVGPVWHGGDQQEEELLQSAVRNSLAEADRLECTSISFPAISTGIFGYPLEKAAKTMIATSLGYLDQDPVNLTQIVFVLFSESDYDTFVSILETFKD